MVQPPFSMSNLYQAPSFRGPSLPTPTSQQPPLPPQPPPPSPVKPTPKPAAKPAEKAAEKPVAKPPVDPVPKTIAEPPSIWNPLPPELEAELAGTSISKTTLAAPAEPAGIECRVCFNIMTDLWVLPACGHAYCKECAQEIAEACWVCSRPVTGPPVKVMH